MKCKMRRWVKNKVKFMKTTFYILEKQNLYQIIYINICYITLIISNKKF